MALLELKDVRRLPLAAEARGFIARSIEEVTRTKQHDPESTTRFRAKCAELIRKFKL